MTEKIKPSLNFTIICDDIRQEAGGKISLMGLFENIYATQFPAVHPRLAIISEWADGRGEFDLRMQILSNDRKVILRETASKLKLNDLNFKHRDVSIHFNIDFTSPGTYWIEYHLDGELIASMPLKVVQIKEQPVH